MSEEFIHSIPIVQQPIPVPDYKDNPFYTPVFEFKRLEKLDERKERQRKKAPRKIRRAPDPKKGLLIDLEG
jgi:hypothetical protein